MKRLTAILACVALLIALPLGPWQHVHAHGHDAHHVAGGLHTHDAPPPVGDAWRSHGPDEDARPVVSNVAASTSIAAGAFLLVSTFVHAVPPPAAAAAPPLNVTTGPDPPPGGLTASRAPPSPACPLA